IFCHVAPPSVEICSVPFSIRPLAGIIVLALAANTAAAPAAPAAGLAAGVGAGVFAACGAIRNIRAFPGVPWTLMDSFAAFWPFTTIALPLPFCRLFTNGAGGGAFCAWLVRF